MYQGFAILLIKSSFSLRVCVSHTSYTHVCFCSLQQGSVKDEQATREQFPGRFMTSS